MTQKRYLAVAFMQLNDHNTTEYTTIDATKIDINDAEAVIRAFDENPLTRLLTRPCRVLLLANDSSGVPTVVQDWG